MHIFITYLVLLTLVAVSKIPKKIKDKILTIQSYVILTLLVIL